MNEGIEEQKKLEEAGFAPEEITQWQTETRAKLAGAGFNEKETNEYFGVHDPDMSATKNIIDHNLAVSKAMPPKKSDTPPTPDQSFLDSIGNAFGYGFQNSVSGLISRGKLPDIVLPEDIGSAARVASMVGQMAGDVPAMVGGFFAGSAAGAAAAGPGAPAGAVAGAGFGTFAVPAAMRQVLTDHYKKGDILTASDFWERTSSTFLNSTREGITGAATALVGGKTTAMAAESGLNALSKVALPAATEVATMTYIGKALEGHLPNHQDFLDGALMVAGLHGAGHVTGKLMDIYSKTGLTPKEVGTLNEAHPTIHQDLLSENTNIPKALEKYIERPAEPKGVKDIAPVDHAKTVEDVAKGMMADLKTAERSQTLIRDEQGNVTNRVENNSYPEWYAKVKSGNLEKTMADLNNPKSAASKRLRLEAENRLAEGYQTKDGITEFADQHFRHSKGMDFHESTQVGQGQVVKFDGNDGIIKTPEGEYVHFDKSVVKENFQEGDVVHFQKDPKNTDMVTAETVFGTKTLEEATKKVEPPKDVLSVGENGEVTVTTPDGGTRPPTSQETILSRIGERGPKAKSGLTFDKFYTNFVDKFDPIKVAQESLQGKTKGEVGAYEFARMANDFKAKVKHVFEKGTLDFKTLAVNGEGFKDIIAPFAKDNAKIDGLKAFMVSKRVLEVEARGIKTGFDLNAATEVVKNGSKEFGATAQKLVDFQNRTLEYALDAGLISKKAHADMVELGKSYVSLSRILDPEISGNKGQGKSKPFKKLSGSELKIQDPFLSMMENTEAIYKAAEVNRSAVSLVELADNTVGQSVIEKVPTKMKPIQVGESEVAKFFQEHGIDGDAEAFNIFRPAEKRNLSPNEFEVMREGKREVYKTTPELAEAFNTLSSNPGAMNFAFKVANALTTVKKIGITLTPDFILKNVFRDQLTAGVFSEGGSVPFKDIFSAMGDIVGKKDVYYDWMKSGGAGGAFLEMDTTYLSKDLLGLSKESGMADKVYNTIKKPVDMLKLLGSITEEGTRLAEFKRVTKGSTEGDVMFKGGMASREVTVDFQRIGAKMSAMNAITAFENVAIQGLDRTARAVKADPVGVTAKGLMYLTAPSVALWWANKDDERVKEIPRWQKDLFWIIPTNDWVPAKDANETTGLPKHIVRQKEDGSYEINKGTIYRLPKPQELGLIFATMPERMLEKFFTDNPHALNDLGDTVKSLITPNFIPDAALPLIEQGVNKNLFTSAPLVSPQMEGRLSDLQYTEYTSETAKILGKIIGQIPVARDIGADNTKLDSPAVIDNYIKSWTGALGTYAVQVADKALEEAGAVKSVEKAAWTVADIPIIKAFVIRHPSASAQSIQDFYTRNTESEKVFKSIDFLKKAGDMEGIRKITDNPDYEMVMFRSGGIKMALGQMSSVIRSINANPTMHKDEKRQQIDTIYYQMQETAKYGNQMMDEFAKTVKKKNENK